MGWKYFPEDDGKAAAAKCRLFQKLNFESGVYLIPDPQSPEIKDGKVFLALNDPELEVDNEAPEGWDRKIPVDLDVPIEKLEAEPSF